MFDVTQQRPPVRLEVIDRASVRRLVQDDAQYMSDAIAGGGNPHHVSLDRQDQVDAFAAALSDPDKAEFLRLYGEELNASAQARLDAAAALNAQEVEKHIETASDINQALLWTGFLALCGFVIFMIRRHFV